MNTLVNTGYKYYDTPDGEDCFKKIFYISKFAAFAGFCGATVDVTLGYKRPTGFLDTIGRFALVSVPLVGIGAVFASITCLSTSVRNKDGPLNHFFGGLAAGATAGAWKQSYKIGSYAALYLSLGAAIIKYGHQEGWVYFPAPTIRENTDPYFVHQNWSALQDPGRTWKKSLDE